MPGIFLEEFCYANTIIIDRHSCQRYLWLQKQGKSVNDGDQPTMVSRKLAGSRTLVMSVAYFWPDFVEPYSFSARVYSSAVARSIAAR